MSGAAIDNGLGFGSLVHPAQAEGPKQQSHSSVELTDVVRSPAPPATPATASTAASTDPTASNAALNQVSPGGVLGASARTGGGVQQTADGNGIQSGSTTDPASAADAMRTVDPSVGGQSPDGGQFPSSLAQGPLPRQVTDVLVASGYSSRSSTGQGVEATANAQSGPVPQQSAQTQPAPDPAGSSGQAARASEPTTISSGTPAAASPSVTAPVSGTQDASNAPDRTPAPGAPGDNGRGSNGEGVEATADAQSRPVPQPSSSTLPDPAGSPGQAALPTGPTTAIGGAQPAAWLPAWSAVYGAALAFNAPDGVSRPGASETAQKALAATAPGPSQAAVGAAAASNAVGAALALSGPLQAELGGVATLRVGDLAGPSPPVMPTLIAPVSGFPGAAFTVTGTGFAAGTTTLPGPGSAFGTLSMPGMGVSSAARAAMATLDREALTGLAISFAAPSTKTGPASSAGGPAAGSSGETSNIASIAPIPGSLTPDRPVPAQVAPANPEPAAEAGMRALPPGTQMAQTTLLPGLTPNPAPAGNPMLGTRAIPAGLPAGAWAYGFGPLPVATPQALLTPGIATSANGRGRRSVEGGMMAYAEHRPVLLDVAPVEPQAPSWRLDDTQTLVSIGAGGVASARERAVALYAALMEQGEGLVAVRPGEGFVTWDGSPLWLSLAGIAKPGRHGILPNVAVPGRVQVLRTVTGEWLVEHTGRPSPSSRPLRHAAASVDDDSLLSDVLYGVSALRGDSDRSRRFERALSALRFAFGLAPPARWRSAEAWASVARLCAVSALQVDDALTPPAETALQAALSVVVSGVAPSPPRDALFVPPLSREQFLKLALSGDAGQIVAALKGLGRSVLDQLRRGVVDNLDRLDTLALAVCLGRLARTIPQSPPNAAAPSQRGAGPTARSVLARSVHGGRRW